MKAVILIVTLSLLITSTVGSTIYAYDDYEQYYQERRAMENAELEQKQNEGDMHSLELDGKVAAYEEQEAKEQAEADKANLQLLIYIGIGVAVATIIFFISHAISNPNNVQKR